MARAAKDRRRPEPALDVELGPAESLIGAIVWNTGAAPHSSIAAFDRSRLIRERRAFSSKVRFFALRGTRVGTRLAGR